MCNTYCFSKPFGVSSAGASPSHSRRYLRGAKVSFLVCVQTLCACVCVCVLRCVRVRERACLRVCVLACVRACVCVAACAWQMIWHVCSGSYLERSIPLKINLNLCFVLCGCDCCAAPPSMLARKMCFGLPLAGPNIEGGAAMPTSQDFKLILRGVVRKRN